METKENHTQHYVNLALVLAIIVLSWVVFCVFLSSKAEASHGRISEPLSLYDINPVVKPYHSYTRYSAIVWDLHRSPFEETQTPIRYVVSWPQLPTVAEAHIRMATVRLAAFMAEQATQADAEQQALRLRLDLEAFRKALALAFMCMGFGIIMVYGWAPKLVKNSSNKNHV